MLKLPTELWSVSPLPLRLGGALLATLSTVLPEEPRDEDSGWARARSVALATLMAEGRDFEWEKLRDFDEARERAFIKALMGQAGKRHAAVSRRHAS